MAPISYEVRPICDYSIPHLGPCVPDVNSIWFKLFLYHKIGYGPPSLLLIKSNFRALHSKKSTKFTDLLIFRNKTEQFSGNIYGIFILINFNMDT